MRIKRMGLAKVQYEHGQDPEPVEHRVSQETLVCTEGSEKLHQP